MSSLIKGPLDGAAAVRELTGAEDDRKARRDAMFAKLTAQNGHGPNRSLVEGGAIHGGAMVDEWTKDAHGVVGAGLTADVEHDGDRGPRAFRDPLSVLDQAADAARVQAVQRLMSAVGALSVDEVAALAWVAWQLPGRKLRRKCEEATATGWCRTEEPKPTARSTPEDRARAALLAAWRQVVALVHGAQSTAAREVAQRDRGDVLADEAARRAGGGE